MLEQNDTGMEPVSIEDLPTVQQALNSCDSHFLANLVTNFLFFGEVSGKEVEGIYAKQLQREVSDALNCIYDMEVASDNGFVGLPLWYLRLRNNGEVRLTPEFLFFEKQAINEIKSSRIEGDTDNVVLPGYSIIHVPWEEVLGYKVYLDDRHSKGLKYFALGELVCELTSFGFDAEDHARGLAEFERACERTGAAVVGEEGADGADGFDGVAAEGNEPANAFGLSYTDGSSFADPFDLSVREGVLPLADICEQALRRDLLRQLRHLA